MKRVLSPFVLLLLFRIAVAQNVGGVDFKARLDVLSSAEMTRDGRFVIFNVLSKGVPRLTTLNIETGVRETVEGALHEVSPDSARVLVSRSGPEKQREYFVRDLTTAKEQSLGSDSCDFVGKGRYVLFRGKAAQIVELATGKALKLGPLGMIRWDESGLAFVYTTRDGTSSKVLVGSLSEWRTHEIWSGPVLGCSWLDERTIGITTASDQPQPTAGSVILVEDPLLDTRRVRTLAFPPVTSIPAPFRIQNATPFRLNSRVGIMLYAAAKYPEFNPNAPQVLRTMSEYVQGPYGAQNLPLAIWWPDSGKLVVSDRPANTRELNRGWALAFDRPGPPTPIQGKGTVSLFDLESGAKSPLFDGYMSTVSVSPTGNHFLARVDGHWWAGDRVLKSARNLTASVAASSSAITEITSPWRVEVVWIHKGKKALLFDQHDAYQWQPGQDGLRRITKGRESGREYRWAQISSSDYPDDRLFLEVRSKRDGREGVAIVHPDGKIDHYALGDHSVQQMHVSSDGSRVLIRTETADSPADAKLLDVRTGKTVALTDFSVAKQGIPVSKRELITYSSKKAKHLTGVLSYPVDYDPRKKYPMVVHIYEVFPNALHQYGRPGERPLYQDFFTRNGYFYLEPDIAYELKNPGPSANECVNAALDSVLTKGVVDPRRIALFGGSWGGFETCFIIGQTQRFAAAIAVSPVTDFISNYLQLRFGSSFGYDHMEQSQGRMVDTIWKDREAYIRNSPITHIPKIKTPLLMYAGGKDENVDRQQSFEMFAGMRRLGKDAVLVYYPNGGHGPHGADLTDFTARVLAFLNVHLRGAPRESWMNQEESGMSLSPIRRT